MKIASPHRTELLMMLFQVNLVAVLMSLVWLVVRTPVTILTLLVMTIEYTISYLVRQIIVRTNPADTAPPLV